MKTLALYNMKGGVGKTTAAVNLAYLCAADGHRTCLWDLDPQGAATYCFRVKPKLKAEGRKLLKGKVDLEELVKATEYANLDVLPADFANRNFDLILDDVKKPTRRLAHLARDLGEDYDYLFFDCPPSISLLSENVFLAADRVLLPLLPATLSLHSFEQLRGYFQEHELDAGRIIPFFSMVDRRRNLHRELLEHPPLGAGVCRTFIPYLSLLEQMSVRREPVLAFAPASEAAAAYRALWRELGERLG